MRLINSLSGRFLILTITFVMIAEILIFVPSIARFRMEWLQERLELSQIASLALLASSNDMVTPELEAELLNNAEVLNIVLRRDSVRELVLASPMPSPVDETFDLREGTFPVLIMDALKVFAGPSNRVIRIIGEPVKGGGIEIETTLGEKPLREALVAYGINIFWLSLFISVVTAALVFLVVRIIMVRPIKRVVDSMAAYQTNPEDARLIISPKSRIGEIRQAETALFDLQNQLTQSLKQKERLAALGGAVARVSHDLRNMLTTAQLLADRMERSADPTVVRTAPKLVGSLNRAISLCEGTLAFGKAEEPAPSLQPVDLTKLVEDVLESDRLLGTSGDPQADDGIERTGDVPDGTVLLADPEQMFRVLANLVGNARQAIAATGKGGRISIDVVEVQGGVQIRVADTGPGLPQKARDHLFKPFQGQVRRGGTGLGLAISSELVRGHGGHLDLAETSEAGTVFEILLPIQTEAAA